MKISELVEKIDLHDSLVCNVEFNTNETKVSVRLDLCNWRQQNYKESEPEITTGVLLFSGVTEFQIQPDTITFDSNEIIETQLVKIDEKDGIEVLKMVLGGDGDVIIIKIQASDVIWKVKQ